MQEIALFLSSIAGACTAVAVKKFPKNKETVTIGANLQIKNQINSLQMEKEILTKTITRLYESDSGLNKIQRDRLLLKYQHQLGVILAKIDKLEAASKHPDLGPVGEGLITLMDQKLSQLDTRLYELSSKISVANTQVSKTETTHQKDEVKKVKHVTEIPEKPIEIPKVQEKSKPEIVVPTVQVAPKAVELTTLTEISNKTPQFPFIEQKQTTQNDITKEIVKPQEKLPEKPIEVVQTTFKPEIKTEEIKHETPQQLPVPINPPQVQTPKPEQITPEPSANLPEEEKIDEDEDDLDKIKGEIMKTLSRLEQAEVE